jgi:hypothetical protein
MILSRSPASCRARVLLVAVAALGCSAGDDPSGDQANAGAGADGFGNAAGMDGDDGPDDGSGASDGSGSDGSGSDGSGTDGSGGASDPVLTPPNPNLPAFPGGGTSDAAAPLPGGMLCDAVAGEGPALPFLPTAECFVDKNDPSSVAATLEQVLECVEVTDTVHVRLTLHPWFVDNTFGLGSIGWPPVRGHWYFDLLGSDHAELILRDGDGDVAVRFKLDYISADPTRPSGHGSLGVLGGDGEMLVGDPASVVQWMTSLDRNHNERGYADYTIDSPLTDASFSPNPATPDWDYRVVYEAWIDLDAFGSAGFGGASIEYVHASPAKSENETIEVEPGECPPCTDDPDAPCGDTDIPPPDEECSNDPDAPCGDSDLPDAGTLVDCLEVPDDPRCRVD